VSLVMSVVLAVDAEVNSDGEGPSVDVGPARGAARLEARVTSWAATSLRIAIEDSPTGVAPWREFDAIVVGGPGTYHGSVGDTERFLRVTWLLEGTSATFGVKGTAYQVYCGPRDLGRYGIRESALSEIATPSARADACITVTAEADGYLSRRYTLPLIAWGDDLRGQCARMAVRYALDQCGWQPDGPDDVVERAFDRAVKWLSAVGAGTVSPAGIIDSTPAKRGSVPRMFSRPRRGWDDSGCD
jgi:phage gp36-like protein